MRRRGLSGRPSRRRSADRKDRSAGEKPVIVIAAWAVGLVAGSLLWFLLYLKSWKKIGRDYRFEDIPPYFREPPSDLRPAFVEVLLREGARPPPRSFTATLFDLARRGYLEFADRLVESRGLLGSREKQETSITLKKDYASASDVLPFEKALLDLLFENLLAHGGGTTGATLELDDLKDSSRSSPRAFQSWYEKWVKDIRREAGTLGLSRKRA